MHLKRAIASLLEHLLCSRWLAHIISGWMPKQSRAPSSACLNVPPSPIQSQFSHAIWVVLLSLCAFYSSNPIDFASLNSAKCLVALLFGFVFLGWFGLQLYGSSCSAAYGRVRKMAAFECEITCDANTQSKPVRSTPKIQISRVYFRFARTAAVCENVNTQIGEFKTKTGKHSSIILRIDWPQCHEAQS